eukprot:m.176210 g.176210  ORF g.176210 m.176210 type:complete len:66 (-) comp15337_c15_seq6:40-237(-)
MTMAGAEPKAGRTTAGAGAGAGESSSSDPPLYQNHGEQTQYTNVFSRVNDKKQLDGIDEGEYDNL